MTKEEYQVFVLRYKGCGACFPIYEKLSKFEKMWFTAIQKDVAELEAENAELKKMYHETDEDNNKLRENIPLLTEAKELLEICLSKARGNITPSWSELIADIEQFLSEVKK